MTRYRKLLLCLFCLLLVGCVYPQPIASESALAPIRMLVPTTTREPVAATPTRPVVPSTPTPSPNPTSTPDPAAYFRLRLPETGRAYGLHAWTPADADTLLEAVRAAYEILLGTESAAPEDVARGADIFQQTTQLALFFFPDAPQATAWRWQQAYDLARQGSTAAVPLYAGLIEAGLPFEAAQPGGVAAWLAQVEPRLVVSQIALTASAGMTNSSLLTLSLAGNPAYFWVTQPAGQMTRVFPLAYGREFQEEQGVEVRLEWQDLTGDDQAEAWLVRVDKNQRWDMASLAIYDLGDGGASKPGPRRLAFQPGLPAMQDGSWQVTSEAGGQPPALQVKLRLDGGEALCEYQPVLTYSSNGQSYRLSAVEQLTLERMMVAGLSEPQARLCMDLAVDWLRDYAQAGDPVALQALEALLPGFPYAVDAILYLNLYPPDEGDRARFELALALARQGDVAGARRWMAAVSEQPSLPQGPWVVLAQNFWEAYGEAGDLRAACLASQACYARSRLSLAQLVDQMSVGDRAAPAAYLRQAGVPISLDGQVDLSGAGAPAFWWVEVTGRTNDVLWFALPQEAGLSLGSLEIKPGAEQVIFEPLAPLLQDAVWALHSGSETLRFAYHQSPAGAPVLRSLGQQRRGLLQNLQQSLFSGAAPAEVLRAAAALRATPYFDCTETTPICQPEESLLQTQALADELNGDLAAAAGDYLQLWRGFPDRPSAWLAQQRLTASQAP